MISKLNTIAIQFLKSRQRFINGAAIVYFGVLFQHGGFEYRLIRSTSRLSTSVNCSSKEISTLTLNR